MALLGSAATAQTSFTVKLGGAFPMGDFADAKVTKNNGIERFGLMTKHTEGGAGLGVNLGLEARFGIPSVSGLGVVLSLDGFYNGLNDDLNDYFADMDEDYFEDFFGLTVDESSVSKPSYFNIPVMLGVNYQYPLGSNLALFATGAVGANMRIITPLTMTASGEEGSYSYDITVKNTYETALTFAFRLAAGIVINDKYSIELGYYNLGAGKVKGESSSLIQVTGERDQEDSQKVTAKSITPSLFTLRVGIGF